MSFEEKKNMDWEAKLSWKDFFKVDVKKVSITSILFIFCIFVVFFWPWHVIGGYTILSIIQMILVVILALPFALINPFTRGVEGIFVLVIFMVIEIAYLYLIVCTGSFIVHKK